jgi:hypothetical protein
MPVSPRFWKRLALPLLALGALVSMLMLGSALTVSSASAAPAAAHALKGTLSRFGTADPLHTSTAKSPLPHVITRPKRGARSIHQPSAAPTKPGAQPSAAPTPFADAGSGKLLTSFNGVSSLDSAVTNFGAEFEPPDQGLCVGNGFVVEPVNSAFTIYRASGEVVAGPFNVNVLFDEGLTEFTSDPRCYFDTATHTWFAIILFINDAGTSARTDIAVNTSGDPTTPWTVYHLDATDDGTNGTPSHPGCPCLGDQPLLGIDKANLYISTNEFSILGPQFNGAQVYALAKSDLVALAASVHFVLFENLTIAGTIAASVQPALAPGSDSAEYFMNSLDPDGTTDNRLGVWAMTNQRAVAKGGIPTLSSVVIGSETYGVPPNAVQKGSSSQLNTGDDRLQQVQFIGGNLWGALTTIITLPNDPNPHAGLAWFKVHPHLKGQQIGGAEVSAQGYVAASGSDVFYPAIQASPSGTAAMVFTISGADTFASAAFAVLSGGHTSFGAIKIALAGTGPYDPNATRWGDYSWAVLDPSGKSFWMATEYMPPLESQTPDGLRNWGTAVIQVSASGA